MSLSSQDVVVKNTEDFGLPIYFLLRCQGLTSSVLMARFWTKGKPTSRSAASTLPSGRGPAAPFTLSARWTGLVTCMVAVVPGPGKEEEAAPQTLGDAHGLPPAPGCGSKAGTVVPGPADSCLLPPVGLKKYRCCKVILTIYNIIGASPASATVEVFVGEAGKLWGPPSSGRPGLALSGAEQRACGEEPGADVRPGGSRSLLN